MTKRASISLIIALAIFGSCVEARLVPAWPLSQLLEKSDLVIIAKAIETKDSKETWKGPETPPRNTSFAAVETTFQPELVLKSPSGEQPADKAILLHFEMRIVNPAELVAYGNGHSFVRFQTENETAEVNDKSGSRLIGYSPRYLLFLQKRADGMFEPVTAQYDAKYSVRLLTETHVGDFLSNLKPKE